MSAIWKAFIGYTTVHGFRHIFESPSRICRVIWLLLLLGATATYLFFVKESVEKFLSNPVSTDIAEVVPEGGELIFPAVTICNLNRFVKSKIDMPEDDSDFHKLGLNLSACEVVKSVNKNMTCGQGLLCAYERYGSEIVDSCNDTTRDRLISALNKTKEPIFDPEQFLEAYGHDFVDMFFYHCRFRSVDKCSPTDFIPSLTETGRCFTFNSGRNVAHATSRSGSTGGLNVMLDVQANENTISDFSRGLTVIVHDQGAFIIMEKGIRIFPGSHAVVGITVTKYKRLPSPYKSNCTQRVLPQIPRYSRHGCFVQCQANKTAEICGCRMIGVPIPQNLPVCAFQHSDCVKQVSVTFDILTCECGIPCEQVVYRTQVSYSAFPDDAIHKILKHKFAYNKSMEYQRRNLVFLQVGFEQQVYSLQTETASYRMGSLFGDIGGNMGLFLGCSLLTLFEFLDLLWRLLEFRANRVKGKSQGECNYNLDSL